MAINALTQPTASTPSYTPSISTDYNAQNEIAERNTRGYNAVSLTNWDATTTAPQVAAGSVIEANGIHYDVTTNTAIDTSSASSGTIYLYFDDTVPQFEYLDTAPTWSNTLNGWYSSTKRFTGHRIDWDGASAFDGKMKSITNYGNDEIAYMHVSGAIVTSQMFTEGGNVGIDYFGYSLGDYGSVDDAGLTNKTTDSSLTTSTSYVLLRDWTHGIAGEFKFEWEGPPGGFVGDIQLRRNGNEVTTWEQAGGGGAYDVTTTGYPGDLFELYGKTSPSNSAGVAVSTIGVSENNSIVRGVMLLAQNGYLLV